MIKLCIKKKNSDIIIAQIYIDDIICGATNEALCKVFTKLMQDEFEMSKMDELIFPLELQTKTNKNRDLHWPK